MEIILNIFLNPVSYHTFGILYVDLCFLIDFFIEPYLLIMEYVMYGKLLAFLRDHRTRQHYYNFSEDSEALTSRDLTIFAYCVARGMEYLGTKGVRCSLIYI